MGTDGVIHDKVGMEMGDVNMDTVSLPTIFEVHERGNHYALLFPLDEVGANPLKISEPPEGIFLVGELWKACVEDGRLAIKPVR